MSHNTSSWFSFLLEIYFTFCLSCSVWIERVRVERWVSGRNKFFNIYFSNIFWPLFFKYFLTVIFQIFSDRYFLKSFCPLFFKYFLTVNFKYFLTVIFIISNLGFIFCSNSMREKCTLVGHAWLCHYFLLLFLIID